MTPLIVADFLSDWIDLIRVALATECGIDHGNISDRDVGVTYFNAVRQRIAVGPRKVILSKYFLCPDENLDGWLKIKEKIETGGNLNPHLRINIRVANAVDHMLFDWGIYHLHLGIGPHEKAPGFTKRSGHLLFGIPTDDAFYAIGIFRHRDWFRDSFVEGVHEQWPHLLARYKLVGAAKEENVTEDQRKVLRTKNVNTLIRMNDGTVYSSIGGGFMANGISTEAVSMSDYNRNRVQRIQYSIQSSQHLFVPHLLSLGYRIGSALRAQLESYGPTSCVIRLPEFDACFQTEITGD